MEEFFTGKSSAEILAEFLYTENQWESIKLDFIRVSTGAGKDNVAQTIHPEVAKEYASLAAKVSKKQLSKLKQELLNMRSRHFSYDTHYGVVHAGIYGNPDKTPHRAQL